MVKPERRTRGDIVAAAAIVAVIAVAAGLIWWTSDARATMSRPAPSPVPYLTPASAVPGTLAQRWAADSRKTTVPVIAGGSVVTGDGRTVDGRDPVSGAVLWSYARDVDLCGVTSVYEYAVAVYPDQRGCGQVSTIDGETGRRGPTRTAYADPAVKLSTDGTTVLSAGDSRLELWRSDMVRMLSYGALDARIKPDVPALPLCRLMSAAASSTAVSVLESCPKAKDLRLTLLRPADEEDTPDVRFVDLPGVTAESGARVIAVSGTTTAVYLPTPKPTVNIVDETGATVASTLLAKPAAPQSTTTSAGKLITWWTGDSVLVFSTDEGADGLRYKYTVSPSGRHLPVGPATVMSGRLLVPVDDGYDVFDPDTGTGERHIPLARKPSVSPVVPAIAGSTVLEQRGSQLVALGSG
ncbi:Rv3212 family protein [Mycobacterium sp. NPDC003449]